MTYNKFELILIDSGKVFTIRDLAVIWGYTELSKVQDLVVYYINKSKLFRLKNGLYSTVPSPNNYLIAQKALRPSYISFYSALKYHGMVFQWYDTVFSASLKSRKISIQNTNYEYDQLKQEIFFDPLGVIQENGFHIAGPERAMCDTLYRDKNATFDNLDKIDPSLLKEVAKIYNQKSLNKAINIWFENLI